MTLEQQNQLRTLQKCVSSVATDVEMIQAEIQQALTQVAWENNATLVSGLNQQVRLLNTLSQDLRAVDAKFRDFTGARTQ